MVVRSPCVVLIQGGPPQKSLIRHKEQTFGSQTVLESHAEQDRRHRPEEIQGCLWKVSQEGVLQISDQEGGVGAV